MPGKQFLEIIGTLVGAGGLLFGVYQYWQAERDALRETNMN